MLVHNPERLVEVYKQLVILPIPCQYLLSLINFIINNQVIFQTNSSMHNVNTRNKNHIHRPNANLSCIQKSTFYAGSKIFNSVPPSVSILKNDKVKFKGALRKYLHTHSFYSVDEFFMCQYDL